MPQPANQSEGETFVAPVAPKNPKANWVTRAFGDLASTALAASLNPHHVTVRAAGEPVRVRLVDERTTVHVTRPYGLGSLHLSRHVSADSHSTRLASVRVTNGEVTIAAFAAHAWLNGVALPDKGGAKQARIAPNATHKLRLLDENGEMTDLTLHATPLHE